MKTEFLSETLVMKSILRNERRRYIIILILFFQDTFVFSQSLSIYGQVNNNDSFDLRGGRVILYDKNHQYLKDTRIDSNGNFCLIKLSKGYCFIYVKHVAFSDSPVKFINVEKNINDLLFLLNKSKPKINIDIINK